MDNNIKNVQEDIAVGVDAITIDIPLRVEMTSVNNAPFEFTTSIDELGQIILTPTTKDMEFVSANTEGNVEYDVPIMEQETITEVDEDSSVMFTKRTTSIMIKGNMLAETESREVSADVDEIGQVVIYPLAEKNTFVTASVADSLNLVTEALETVEYFGYRLVNNGDGWDIYNYTNELIEEGVATLAEAKIVACTTEIHLLEPLVEELDAQQSTENSEGDAETDEAAVPENVTAEVIEEAITTVSENKPLSVEEVTNILKNLTDDFTDSEGAIKCDTDAEKVLCLPILEYHYNDVKVKGDIDADYIVITYKDVKTLVESITDEERLNIINRFLQGNVALFTDTTEPKEEFLHLTELDASGYEYYYDKETDAIVAYPVEV